MQNAVIRYLVYTFFFLICLTFFTVKGFPLHLIQGQLEREVERRLGMRMTTGKMEVLFPNGVEASNLRLMQEGKEGRPGLAILVTQARARLSLLGLISGNKDVSFSAELLNGKVEGDISINENRQKIDARLSSLDLGRLPIWQELIGLPLAGKITGKIDLTLVPADMKASQGTIELALEQGALGEGSIRGLTTPPISLGKTQANLEITKGKAEIRSFQVRSDDIEASLEGYFWIKQRLEQASAHCQLRFKPSAAFLDKNTKFKDIISLSGMNRAKDNEGYFAYSVYGRLTHPQFRPAR